MTSSGTGVGFWDDDEAATKGSTTIAPTRQASTRTAVKDDWEDDDDESEDEIPSEERNKQIWEDANTKTHHPMPDVIVSRNSAISTPAAHLPPQGVFDQLPKMKILKRPTATFPTTVQPIASDNAKSLDLLREREARYNAARERIFGSESPASSSSNVATNPKSPPQVQVKVAREPRGPASRSNEAGPERGFQGRNKPRDND